MDDVSILTGFAQSGDRCSGERRPAPARCGQFPNNFESPEHASVEGRPAYEEDRMPSRDQQAVPQEPNLSDVLNDPIVMAVMRADGVSLDELARILGIPVCRAAFRSAHPRKGEET